MPGSALTRMRGSSAAIVLMLMVTAATEPVGRTALGCDATITGTARQNEVTTPMTLAHPQLFVIDADGRTVYRALEPRRQIDNLCLPFGGPCSVSVTADRIRVTSSGSVTGPLATGRAVHSLHIDRRTTATT